MTDFIKMIKERRSIRNFKSKQISDKDISLIISAGAYAPSALNKQPWKFTVVQDEKFLISISNICSTFMLNSDDEYLRASADRPNYSVFYHAPTVIFISMDTDVTGSIVDCACAAQNMLLAAHSLGLGSCYIGGFAIAFVEDAKLRSQLGIPKNYMPIFSIALGYREDVNPTAPPRRKDVTNYIL